MPSNLDQLSAVPAIVNEPVRDYAPGSPERERLQAELKRMAAEVVEIPLVIGGREVRTGQVREVRMPHAHGEVIAKFHLAGAAELKSAATAARIAKAEWEALPWSERTAVFLKAAELLAGPWRDRMNAATMLGQGKNVYQAEIDAACEMIDFFRFNAQFYREILAQQPASGPGVWNRTDYRPLEGFVLAISPFNFTAIAGNLPAAPALVGNTVVWKPSDTQMRSAWEIQRLFQAAGLPDGVINLVPADGPLTSEALLPEADLAGVHFTGSTGTFKSIWKGVAANLDRYRTYPRLVGETGGKDFVFAHASADVDALATALARGAFEYQGQKCSAASRAYVPKSIWPKVRDRLLADVRSFKMGDPRDFSNFVGAVIDERSFKKITGYLTAAARDANVKTLIGGNGDARKGWFVEPTVLETADPRSTTMREEIFGPVLTVHPYDDAKLDEALELCDTTTAYALTGAIFAQDRRVVDRLAARLRHAAGNFYINDKPTGAVVGQQPFGGARASGTNDKAGSALNLLRWLSPRTMKETLSPPRDYRYPFLG